MGRTIERESMSAIARPREESRERRGKDEGAPGDRGITRLDAGGLELAHLPGDELAHRGEVGVGGRHHLATQRLADVLARVAPLDELRARIVR